MTRADQLSPFERADKVTSCWSVKVRYRSAVTSMGSPAATGPSRKRTPSFTGRPSTALSTASFVVVDETDRNLVCQIVDHSCLDTEGDRLGIRPRGDEHHWERLIGRVSLSKRQDHRTVDGRHSLLVGATSLSASLACGKSSQCQRR